MKQLVYVHAKLTPLVVVLSRAVTTWIVRRLWPVVSRLLPAEKAGLLAIRILWLLGLVCQAVMVWLLSELVTLAIGLYELWAVMAQAYLDK